MQLCRPPGREKYQIKFRNLGQDNKKNVIKTRRWLGRKYLKIKTQSEHKSEIMSSFFENIFHWESFVLKEKRTGLSAITETLIETVQIC